MNEAEFIEISDFINLLADRSKVITLEGFNSNLTLQVKDDGGLIGNEWQKDIPDYWASVKPIKWLKDE